MSQCSYLSRNRYLSGFFHRSLRHEVSVNPARLYRKDGQGEHKQASYTAPYYYTSRRVSFMDARIKTDTLMERRCFMHANFDNYPKMKESLLNFSALNPVCRTAMKTDVTKKKGALFSFQPTTSCLLCTCYNLIWLALWNDWLPGDFSSLF